MAHRAIENPTGLPVNRSFISPKGAAHHAGHGSDRRSRQLRSAMNPKSGYQPLVEMIGSAESSDAATTVAAGIRVA